MEEENKKERKKISRQARIEADNLIEEASEILSSCIRCGMCREVCPVFKVLRDESVSPRGHSILLSDKVLEKIVFECNLCKACERKCPLGIKVCDAILKAREALVLRDKGTKENKEMMREVRKTGNPFGKNGNKDPDKLYCC